MFFNRYKKIFAIQSGYILELYQFGLQLAPGSTKKINAKEYIDLRTGELKRFKKTTKTHKDNLASIKKSMRKLKRKIYANFDGSKGEIFLTLTYGKNMQDYKQVYADFKSFIRAWRKVYGKTEYIIILEPQNRGAWHVHALLKCLDKTGLDLSQALQAEKAQQKHPRRKTANEKNINAFIAKKLWKKGFCFAKAIYSPEISLYLTSGKFDCNDGGILRLKHYPSNMRVFRASRGIKDSLRFEIDFSLLKKSVLSTSKCLHEEKFAVKNKDNQLVQSIRYAVYKLSAVAFSVLMAKNRAAQKSSRTAERPQRKILDDF